jgi:hypothetical protein
MHVVMCDVKEARLHLGGGALGHLKECGTAAKW